jgi:hypothetical protein
VYSVSTLARPMTFSFLYRKVSTDNGRKWNDSMYCDCVALHMWRVGDYPKGMDYSGHESGFVITKKLPPGQYEIYNYEIRGTPMTWSSKTPFSIPFTIESGKATYIGNFARGCWCEVNTIAANLGYFVISDQSARDIPIARAKEPALTEINLGVWDATKLNSPIFFTSEPN